jgi:hypothetical protein
MSEPCGCCKTSVNLTPEDIENRPGLSAIAYRVGTFATFRQTMLTAISQTKLTIDGQSFRPLDHWKTRQSDDYGIALLEMWAYVADILTFYQERIANEAYLQTALQLDSIIRLANLIGYRLAPGVAARTYLAYTLEKNISLKITPRLRVQSVPGQGETVQKFETIESLNAQALFNYFRIYPAPQNYAPLSAGNSDATISGEESMLKPGDFIVIYDPILKDGSGTLYIVDQAPLAIEYGLNFKNSMPLIKGGSGVEIIKNVAPMEISESGAKIIAQETNILISGSTMRTLPHVEDKEITGNETIDWRQVLNWKPAIRTSFGSNAVARQWKRKFRLFGHNAPSQYFSVSIDSNKEVTWSQESYDYYLSTGKALQLETTYDDLKENTEVLLVAALKGGGTVAKEYTVTAVEQTQAEIASSSSAAPATQATVTQISVGDTLPAGIDVRSAILYELNGEPLSFWQKKYATAFSNNTVYVPLGELKNSSGIAYTAQESAKLLEAGRRIILEDGVIAPQATTISSTEVEDDHLKITLDSALNPAIQVDTAMACANVVLGTHGETVARETLGSGDASQAFQSFTLKKSPVTYIPQAGATNGTAPTLEVRVDDVLWKEVDTLYGQNDQARVYTTSIDDQKALTIEFGDGQTGARLPTGRDNLVATYRQGIGKSGNVKAKSLSTPLDKPTGLKSVINPLAASGGAEPETLSKARQNAPNTVRTLGRIVSLRDFEDAARAYAGIAKVRATWQWDGFEQAISLIVAGDDGVTIEAGSTTHQDLLSDLNGRRDPHRKLTINSYTPVSVQVTATIKVAADQNSTTVQANALSALESYLDFDNLELGQSIHLSDVMAVLQAVKGVEAVDVDKLQYKNADDRSGHDASTDPVQAHLLLLPNELATVSEAASDLVINIGLN